MENDMNTNVEVLENTEIGVKSPVLKTDLAKWNLDATHSHAGFSVRHLMISNVKGEFRKLEGTLEYDPLRIEEASVSIAIDPASLDTREANRDAHLRNADFFDVEKY